MRFHELKVLVVLLQIVHYFILITEERAALAISIELFMTEARSPGISLMKH